MTDRNNHINPILRTLVNAMSPNVPESIPESDEEFPKEPDFYERNYGEYAEEKMLDDMQRVRDVG